VASPQWSPSRSTGCRWRARRSRRPTTWRRWLPPPPARPPWPCASPLCPSRMARPRGCGGQRAARPPCDKRRRWPHARPRQPERGDGGTRGQRPRPQVRVEGLPLTGNSPRRSFAAGTPSPRGQPRLERRGCSPRARRRTRGRRGPAHRGAALARPPAQGRARRARRARRSAPRPAAPRRASKARVRARGEAHRDRAPVARRLSRTASTGVPAFLRRRSRLQEW